MAGGDGVRGEGGGGGMRQRLCASEGGESQGRGGGRCTGKNSTRMERW